MRCLQDIINDEHFTKFGDFSEIDIKYAASLGNSASPQFEYEYGSPHPDPEPPPHTPHINIVDVPEHEYSRDEQIPAGTSVIDDPIPEQLQPNTDHLLWTT